MTAKLFKDFTATDAHARTALGNERDGKSKRPTSAVTAKPTEKFASVVKVDQGHGLVLGWAIVCKQDGADYWDLQKDHIPEDSMLAASVDFMGSARIAKEMHVGDGKGTILFAFPLTTDIANAFGVTTEKTGLMIAMKPDSADMLAKFVDGTYTGFSIGGFRVDDEEVD